MILPTGQIMFTVGTDTEPQMFVPSPGVEKGAAPTLLAVSNFTLKVGSKNNVLYGIQLNGLSQNNAYGDEDQMDTNYPLVRFRSFATNRIYYAWTHDDSTHSISPGAFMFTHFDLNPAMPPGKYLLEAVASGVVSSNSLPVTVK